MKAQSALTMDCGENVDDYLLRLPGRQVELLWALRATGKRVITVLIGGRPYEMGELTGSNAIIQAFYPGLTGGEAIAKLIFGQIEPAGRLCVTLPDHVGQLPVAYNAKDSYRHCTYYRGSLPTFSFGHGLTYTNFGYELVAADSAAVTVRITNTGSRPGWAVPQLYLHRTQGVVTARKALWAFDKRLLSPGESWQTTLPIPEEALMQFDWNMHQRRIPGKIEWFVQDCGQTHLSGDFNV
jgi:beta-glucosidase